MNALKTPLATSSPNQGEIAKLLELTEPLARYLNCPGDWGYGTLLGDMALRLNLLRDELKQVAA